MNIVIVGAGPVGCFLAKELAKQGNEVKVFEEHQSIGRPIACTGIVTSSLFEFIEYDKSYVINKLNSVKVISPSGEKVEIPLNETVICREKFDKFLMRQAISWGAEFFTSHKFLSSENKTAVFKHNSKDIKFKFDILIGADGPFSAVGRSAGLLEGRQYYVGHQARAEGNFDPHLFETFFGSKIAPGFFAWSVPENEKISRIGVASKKNVHTHFNLLRKKFNGKIIEYQSGPIPIYDGAGKVQKDSIFLTGDAAGFIKNTTGGGLATSIWAAKILADCIKNKKDYSKALKPVRRELWLHAKIRRMLDCFSDSDYEKLIGLMSSEKIRKILAKHPREYPSKFIWKLLTAQPRFLSFAKYILA